jgi:hypothetical protein
MKLLCFHARRFRWKTHSKTLPQAPDLEVAALHLAQGLFQEIAERLKQTELLRLSYRFRPVNREPRALAVSLMMLLNIVSQQAEAEFRPAGQPVFLDRGADVIYKSG